MGYSELIPRFEKVELHHIYRFKTKNQNNQNIKPVNVICTIVYL